MAQGTVTPMAPAIAEPAEAPPAEQVAVPFPDAVLRDLVRDDLLGGIDEDVAHGVGHLMQEQDDAGRDSGQRAILREIGFEAERVLQECCRHRRRLRERERLAFRFLASLGVSAVLDQDDLDEVILQVGEVVVDVLTEHGKAATARWTADAVRAGVDDLASELRSITDSIFEAVAEGCDSETETTAADAARGWRGVLTRLLDSGLCGDQIGAAAAEVGIDVSVPHQVVLLLHPRDDRLALDAAADEAELEVPHCVDLGLGDRRPLHRRLVFEAVTPGRALDARVTLHTIAARNGLLAVAPPSVQSLDGLQACYAATVERLSEARRFARGVPGILDPTCLGTRPLPSDATTPDPVA